MRTTELTGISLANYRVIGLMSGTSLDGLDIAYCKFSNNGDNWEYEILCAETLPYTAHWKTLLANLESGSALDFVTADVEYGHLLGVMARAFIDKNKLEPDFISSHGHTIFHQPDRRITSQIGRGSAIAAETGLPVICDFRSLDVALGGQGAPLVPIGDELLFRDFDFCLNIGGFANISSGSGNRRIAFDICPANIVMNRIALLAGQEYDRDGMLASTGKIDRQLLDMLNSLAYYHQPGPKSLGKEWVITNILPFIENANLSPAGLLATFCEHIAMQVASAVSASPGGKILATGGGAFNKFLIERIGFHARPEIILPDANTVNFKEALIFAFLGVLRMRNEINCLRSVTGAVKDSCGGCIY